MSDGNELRPWELALRALLASPHRPGDVITHEELHEWMGIEMPSAKTPKGEADRLDLLYLDNLDTLKRVLLEDHCIDLDSRAGRGYEWVPPCEQAERAVRKGTAQLVKDVRRILARTRHVDTRGMTSAERQRQRDDLTAAVTFSEMVRSSCRTTRRRFRKPAVFQEPQTESA